MIMDLSDLKDDPDIREKLQNLHESVDKIDAILEVVLNGVVAEELQVKDRMNYDLFVAYTLNTLYWMYLRTKGIDPNSTDVKNELTRVREYMMRAKNAVERHTLRPTVDKTVAERFVRHGIGHHSGKGKGVDGEERVEEPVKKRRRT